MIKPFKLTIDLVFLSMNSFPLNHQFLLLVFKVHLLLVNFFSSLVVLDEALIIATGWEEFTTLLRIGMFVLDSNIGKTWSFTTNVVCMWFNFSLVIAYLIICKTFEGTTRIHHLMLLINFLALSESSLIGFRLFHVHLVQHRVSKTIPGILRCTFKCGHGFFLEIRW